MWSYKSVINSAWFVAGAWCYEIEWHVNVDRSSSSKGTLYVCSNSTPSNN